MRTVLAGGMLLLLAACASSPDIPPLTVGHVDLERYQGTWYELARLPMFFQRKCVQSQADYRLREDGRLAVVNRCRTLDGSWEAATGEAWPQVAGETDKLWVRFDNWFSRLMPRLTRGEYWVLYVDDDYQTALVGHPSRDYLWLLSRTPEVSAQTQARLLSLAHERGYDVGKLIWRAEVPGD
nr:lipocalin family protein [Stutzerimonas azotifigens]